MLCVLISIFLYAQSIYSTVTIPVEKSNSIQEQHIGIKKSLNADDTTISQHAMQKKLAKITNILHQESITVAMWEYIIKSFIIIDSTGTEDNRNVLGAFIQKHLTSIEHHMASTLHALMQNDTIPQKIANVLQHSISEILIKTLPSISIATLKLLSNNIPLTPATPGLVDVGILSAIDGLIHIKQFQTSKTIKNYFTTTTHFNTPELATLHATAITLLKNVLAQTEESAIHIVHRLSFTTTHAHTNTVLTEQQKKLVTYLHNSLTIALNNNIVRNTTITVLTYAVEGAMLHAWINKLGFDVYEKKSCSHNILAVSMIHGALLNLYTHLTRHREPADILQRVNNNAIIMPIQNYLAKEIKGLSSTETLNLDPSVTQRILDAAMNSLINTSGGWQHLIQILYAHTE